MPGIERGFTLIELLVVIAIIGLLASIVLASLNAARLKGKIARAQSDLVQIRNAMALMSSDTGLWPNGCEVSTIIVSPLIGAGNEVALNTAAAGLLVRPTVGVTDAGSDCAWTAQAVANWNGPYTASTLIDPWGTPYWFDNDYVARRDCPTPNANPSAATMAVVVSDGPNKVGGADSDSYDCDDIYLDIHGI